MEYFQGGQKSIREYWPRYLENTDVLVSLLNHWFLRLISFSVDLCDR